MANPQHTGSGSLDFPHAQALSPYAKLVFIMSRSWLRASASAAASAIDFSSQTGNTISGRGGLRAASMTYEVWAPHLVVRVRRGQKLDGGGDDAQLFIGGGVIATA